MTEISLPYIVAGVFFQTIQTTLTAVAWYFILAAGYPDGGVRYRDILAAYAAGVAMNGFLPANIGTFASLLMYVALIRGSTFTGVLGATFVQKIFYTASARSSTSTSSSRCRARSTSSSGSSATTASRPAADRRRSGHHRAAREASSGAGSRGSGRRRSRAALSSLTSGTTSSRCCFRRSARGSRSSS